MTEWTTKMEWETETGVSHAIDERYNRRKGVYEVRMKIKARNTWFIRDRWTSENGLTT